MNWSKSFFKKIHLHYKYNDQLQINSMSKISFSEQKTASDLFNS